MVVSEVKAVTADLSALGVADCSILNAGEALLEFACAGAAIVRVGVAIVALLTADNEFISAGRSADCASWVGVPVAVPAGFNGAFRRTAVSRLGVAIIAGLSRYQNLITTDWSALGVVEILVLDTIPAWFFMAAIGATKSIINLLMILTHHR